MEFRQSMHISTLYQHDNCQMWVVSYCSLNQRRKDSITDSTINNMKLQAATSNGIEQHW